MRAWTPLRTRDGISPSGKGRVRRVVRCLSPHQLPRLRLAMVLMSLCHAVEALVFVGPNNAGKSVSLRNIRDLISSLGLPPLAVKSLGFDKGGSEDDLITWLETHANSRAECLAMSLCGSMACWSEACTLTVH